MTLSGNQTVTLQPSATEVARARAVVREHCRHLSPWQVQVGQLLTSELVSNAIRHGAGPVNVSVACDSEHMIVEVTDSGPGRVAVRRERVEDLEVGGRGLSIVESLATRWGVRQVTGGKTVWFHLDEEEEEREPSTEATGT